MYFVMSNLSKTKNRKRSVQKKFWISYRFHFLLASPERNLSKITPMLCTLLSKAQRRQSNTMQRKRQKVCASFCDFWVFCSKSFFLIYSFSAQFYTSPMGNDGNSTHERRTLETFEPRSGTFRKTWTRKRQGNTHLVLRLLVNGCRRKCVLVWEIPPL